MIYLKLFLTFFEIGAVSFGGGYGMISLIRELTLQNGWLTEDQLLNFIAVSESTPGPIAINMATFIGSSQGGILGSLAATLGVVLPSFLIILIIVSLIRNLLKYAPVQAALTGIRPAVVGLILSTAAIMFLSTLLGITTRNGGFALNLRGFVILAVIVGIAAAYRHFRKKAASPILLIILSAILGGILYSF